MEKKELVLKNYPVSIAVYLIYSLLWARMIYIQYHFSRQTIRSVATGGEVVGLITFFVTAIGVIIGFVMLLLYLKMNASYNNRFYGVLAALIVVQVIIGCCN